MIDRERNIDGTFTKIHGGRRTRLYRVWCAMRERCNNPHNMSYPRYGGRGITVCDEWNSFSSFREWAIANGYRESLTIDRIDGNKGYSPDNCRWATTAEQNRNYSRNHNITYNGVTKCVAEWAEETGIKSATILWRLKNNKTMEEVFSKSDGRSLRWKRTISEC